MFSSFPVATPQTAGASLSKYSRALVASGSAPPGPRHFLSKSRRFTANCFAILVLVNSSAPRQASRLFLLEQGHSPRARKDCNAEDAKGLVPIRKARHVWPRLPLHTPNNWEQTGRQRAETEKWRLCKTAGNMWPHASSSTASLHSGKNLHNLCVQLGELQSQDALTRV